MSNAPDLSNDRNLVSGGDESTNAESKEDINLKKSRRERKELEKKEKAEKLAIREKARLLKSLSCDHRIHVRLQAADAVKSFSSLLAAHDNTSNISEESFGRSSSSSSSSSNGDEKSVYDNSKSTCGGSGGSEVLIDSSSLSGLDLREFSLNSLPVSGNNWAGITSLNLSHNELSELPGIDKLTSLYELDLSRNWFKDIPAQLQKLLGLVKLNMSRNFLRPNTEFLSILLHPPGMPSLQDLDLTFNKKCYTQDLSDLLTSKMPSVAVRITVTWPPPDGAYVGHVFDRDATLLRSQLEPYTTQYLKRRLALTFGQEDIAINDKASETQVHLARAEVMRRVLECYAKAGVVNERRLVRVNGTPVDSNLLADILAELRSWSSRNETVQERPMIHAQKYMIIRSPVEFEEKLQIGSAKAGTAKRKYEQNAALWNLAATAIKSVDPEFASEFTGLAVTYQFKGSPHIDTTNTGPFYGLSLGDFADGTGGIQVELDPMTVAEVNTKNRLGKIDGRCPHWVAPYDERCERYSLIYYHTEGIIVPQTTAVFGPVIES